MLTAFDSDAAFLNLGCSKFYAQEDVKYGLKTKTITLPGGEKLKLVWHCLNGGDDGKDGYYWIGKYEVTQAQWYGVMGSSPSSLRNPFRAVEYVSWEECQEFCRRAGNGLRLPTEAEWVCAQTESERFDAHKSADNWNLVCHMRDNSWEWCEEGVCRKNCAGRCFQDKFCKAEGLGFRVCCSPGPLDKFHGDDILMVAMAIFVALIFCVVIYMEKLRMCHSPRRKSVM